MNNTTYRNQDGCHNCIHCLEDTRQDDGTYYFCNVRALISRDEFYKSWWSMSDKKYKAQRKFMNENEVEGWGICSEHVRIDE